MRFGFVLPNNFGVTDPHHIVELAIRAEGLGLDSVWVNHHIVNVGYIHDRLGSKPYHDALAMLGWVGARTESIRIGTSVLVLPYLRPHALAKTLATLDQLSGGRLTVGVGVGNLPEENEILDAPWDERGAWSDEFIDVMRTLWTQTPAAYDGDHFCLDGVISSPQPIQAPLPVWVGGSGAAARQRAATRGQGWHPLCSSRDIGASLADLRARASGADRTGLGPLTIAPRIDIALLADPTAVDRWSEAGADELIVSVNSGDLDVIREALHHVAAIKASSA